MKRVPFKSVAGALRVAAGVAAMCAALMSGMARGQVPGQGQDQRWQTTFDKLKGLSVGNPLPSFARRGRPVRLVRGDVLRLSSNGTEIPATLFVTPECTLSPGSRDVDCEHNQGQNALVAVLALTKHQVRRGNALPAALLLVPPGARGNPAGGEIRTLTPANDRGPLTGDRYFWIAIDHQQYPQLAPAGIAFCLDECDTSGPLYTLNEAQSDDIGPKVTGEAAPRLQGPAATPGGVGVPPPSATPPSVTPPVMMAAGRGNPGAPGQPSAPEITVTVHDVPPEYSDRVVFRLVLSAVRMRDGASLSDIIGIRGAPPEPGANRVRVVVLALKDTAAVDTIGAEHGGCGQGSCDFHLSLHPRYVDSRAGREPHFFAGMRPNGADSLPLFYRRLNIENNVEIPRLPGRPPDISLAYLPDDSIFQITFKAGKGWADVPTEVPRWDGTRNVLRLSVPANPGGPLGPTLIATDDPSLPPPGGSATTAANAPPVVTPPAAANPAPTPPAPAAPAPAAPGQPAAAGPNTSAAAPGPGNGIPPPGGTAVTPPQAPASPSAPAHESPVALHLVLKPAEPRPDGWSPIRLAKRLLDILRASAIQFSPKDGDVSRPPQLELTAAEDAVIAWSGAKPQVAPKWMPSRPVEGVRFSAPAQPPADRPGGQGLRIRPNDAVAFSEFTIETPFLYERWQVSIDAVRKVNGQELPDSSNELCSFSLSFTDSGERIRLTPAEQAGRRILQSDPIPSQKFASLFTLPAQLEVQNNDANATCAPQRSDLGAFESWKTSDHPADRSLGRIETRVSLGIRGRWLLALFGPQSIGTGLDDASAAKVSDVKDDIINSLIKFLGSVREQRFPYTQPMKAAVGYDLALMSSADAGSRGFAETSVLTGGYRQPKTNDFELDREGNKRLDDFLQGPHCCGSAADFREVGEKIARYSRLFGELSGESHPVVIYVGAAPSLRNLCSSWKEMTRDAAALSGGPRAFGIVFANVGAGQINEQLERTGRGREKALGLRVRGLTCEGDSGSMLLVVPFPDLVARPSETVLNAAFDIVQEWMALN
jgi:hypothetical protein